MFRFGCCLVCARLLYVVPNAANAVLMCDAGCVVATVSPAAFECRFVYGAGARAPTVCRFLFQCEFLFQRAKDVCACFSRADL